MYKLSKKIVSICLGMTLLLSLGITALAATQKDMVHTGDLFEYGQKYSGLKIAQYSNFNCPKVYHRATAVVYVGNTKYSDVKYAVAGKTAPAKTDYYKKLTQYNSYYSHVN